MQLGGLPVETDVSAGVWVSSGRRRGTPGTVGALVPAVFEAYARVLHPAVRYAGDDDVEVPWAEVAAHNGTVAHPLMQWVPLTGSWDYRTSDSQPPVWDDAPSEGHLPVAVAARLAAVLRRHTGTPEDCRFGRWAGLRVRRRRPRAGPPAAAARRARRGGRARHRRRRRPQPRPRAARAEREPVVAGGPGVVRRHRHRPHEHLRRRQRAPASPSCWPPRAWRPRRRRRTTP